MTANQDDDGPYNEVIAFGAFGDTPKEVPLRAGPFGPEIGTATAAEAGVRVEIAGRTLYDQRKAADREFWTERAARVHAIVHSLTGPEAGLPAELERWEVWHLHYAQELSRVLAATATTAASIVARRDGAL